MRVSAGFAMCSSALGIAFLQASLGRNSVFFFSFFTLVHQTSGAQKAERDPLWRSELQRRDCWVACEFW